jgi:hypothetical protein
MFTLFKSTSILLTLSLTRSLSTTTRTAAKLSSVPKIVKVSSEEKAAGSLTDRNLELANRAMHHDGLVVLENAISDEKLDFLNQKMVQDANTLQAAGDESPYNYNRGFVPLLPKKK